MRKQLKIRLLVIALAVLIGSIGVTFAFMLRRARVKNTFETAKVTCAVSEKLDGAEADGSFAIGTEKSDIRVQNTGNINAYLRLRLSSYFTDAQGNVSGAARSALPQLTLNDGWLAGADNTFYYTKAVPPGDFTPALCQPFSLQTAVLQDGKTVYQVVDVYAEAIQAEPDDAVLQAWGATAKDGVLTSVQ